MLSVMLMVLAALLVGFAGGYFAALRQQPSDIAPAGDAAAPAAAKAEPATPLDGGRDSSPRPGAGEPPEPAKERAPVAGTTAARTGRLVVQTTPPGAAVTINGKPSGRAPLTRDALAFGDYTVRVLLPGYQARNAQVRLTADAATRTLSMQLQREGGPPARPATPTEAATQKPAPVPAAPMARPAPATATGILEIDSRPVGAQVFVDGRPVGPTPVRVPDVAPGGRVVRLEMADHRTWTEVAQVARGRTTRVAGSLEPIR